MIYSLVLFSLLSTCLASCADNCARAVANTKNTARYLDCPSFMIDTYTPATAATTTTYTPTVYSIVGGGAKKKRSPQPVARANAVLGPRQVIADPTSIPTYATSACTAPSMFSTACECLGYTATTTTAPSPWHTVTASVTTTITVCDPAQDYGVNWTGGVAGFGASIDEYYSITEHECCALCYAGDAHCVIFDWEGPVGGTGDCGIWHATGGQGGQAVPFCPWGTDTVSNAAFTSTVSTVYDAFGAGPCGTVLAS